MQNILDIIEARDNLFLKELSLCKESGYKTYIYGGREGAANIEKRLKTLNFTHSGKVINKKYGLSNEQAGIFYLEDILNTTNDKINLIIGFRGYHSNILDSYKDKLHIIINCDCFAGNYSADPEIMTTEYISEHNEDLCSVYNSLSDDLSMRSLIAYINQKISMDYKYLKEVKVPNQYFDKDIISLTDNEVFIDCGAYNGDSAMSFIEELHARDIHSYKRIISFEPDPYNFKGLCDRHLDNHITINKGTSDKKEILHFSISETSSSINEDGEIIIETDTIDNVLNGEEATFIKMDIEGAELASLKGARDTIMKSKPKLAICIYHKREDLWTIQQYIQSIVPEYKFYIRAYEDTATELVLYAVIK